MVQKGSNGYNWQQTISTRQNKKAIEAAILATIRYDKGWNIWKSTTLFMPMKVNAKMYLRPKMLKMKNSCFSQYLQSLGHQLGHRRYWQIKPSHYQLSGLLVWIGQTCFFFFLKFENWKFDEDSIWRKMQSIIKCKQFSDVKRQRHRWWQRGRQRNRQAT